jgi:hypothetical protein
LPKLDRRINMATTRKTKVQRELDDALDTIADVKETLNEAYTPEASRESMAVAIGEVLESLAKYDDDDGDEDQDED